MSHNSSKLCTFLFRGKGLKGNTRRYVNDKPNFGGIQRYSMGHVPTFIPGAGRAGEEAQKFDLWDSPNFVSSAEGNIIIPTSITITE